MIPLEGTGESLRVLGKAYGGVNIPGYIIQRHLLGNDDQIEIAIIRANSEAH